MKEWEVWRTDDSGVRTRVAAYPDRIEALAQILVLEAGHPHKQHHEVVGDRRPLLTTNRDLYVYLVGLGEELVADGRALLDYLCALWSVSRPLGVLEELEPDLLAAMMRAAASCPPARPEPSWRTADFSVAGEYAGFVDFTKV